MVDYRINLAKTLIRSPEQRRQVYHGMIIYLSICAAALAYTAYKVSAAVISAYNDERHRAQLVKTSVAASKFTSDFYNNPDRVYREIEKYAADLSVLKSAMSQSTHFLPVLNQLYGNLSEEIAINSLNASADRNIITFSLIGPVKAVKDQQARWNKNTKLKALVNSVRQVSGEQTLVGEQWVNNATFECVLKSR